MIYPWLSDVLALTHNGGDVKGISNGVLSLTVSDNSTVCFLARAVNNTDSVCTSNCSTSFVEPVGVYVGASRQRTMANESLSSHHRVCGTLPSLASLCNDSSMCMSRGTSLQSCLWCTNARRDVRVMRKGCRSVRKSVFAHRGGWYLCRY